MLMGTLSACDSPARLGVAYHPFVGYETLPLAEDLGWLPERAVLYRFESSEGSMRALEEGRVQAAALTLDEALRLREKLPGITVVLVMDESAGADVLLAKPSIGSIGELAGARVAYQPGSVSEFFLLSALARFDLSLHDIESVNLSGAAQIEAFAAGDIDAVVTYPPVADSITRLGATRLFDSAQTPGGILDVLVVDARRMVNREETLAALIEGHFRALDHLRTNREDLVFRYAEYQQTDSDSIRTALAGIKLPALASVRSYLSPGGVVEKTASEMQQLGVVPQAENGTRDLVTTRYLPRKDR
jgi:NitT/TauT family transport system substrate-binding protein